MQTFSNDCRFPHILPENNNFGPGRIGSKPRYPLNGVTNVTNLEEKFSRMNVQEVRNMFLDVTNRANPQISRMKTPPTQAPVILAVRSRRNDVNN
jgi:hypothetical protein